MSSCLVPRSGAICSVELCYTITRPSFVSFGRVVFLWLSCCSELHCLVFCNATSSSCVVLHATFYSAVLGCVVFWVSMSCVVSCLAMFCCCMLLLRCVLLVYFGVLLGPAACLLLMHCSVSFYFATCSFLLHSKNINPTRYINVSFYRFA